MSCMNQTYRVFTDGSAFANPGLGGWGVVLISETRVAAVEVSTNYGIGNRTCRGDPGPWLATFPSPNRPALRFALPPLPDDLLDLQMETEWLEENSGKQAEISNWALHSFRQGS